MMPPSTPADNVMPGECATMASGCTLSTSPPASAQRAMALDGLCRIVTSTGGLLGRSSGRVPEQVWLRPQAGALRLQRMSRSSASSQSPVASRATIASGPPGAREGLGQAGGRIDLQRRARRRGSRRRSGRARRPRSRPWAAASRRRARPAAAASRRTRGTRARAWSRHTGRARTSCPPRPRRRGSAAVRRCPCTSTAWLPAAWCRPSMFCVTTPAMNPPSSSRARAVCAGLGRMLAPTSGSAQHCHTRAGSRASMSTWPSTIGSRRSHMPPGERKSGRPLAVETPAPVSTSTGAWRSRNCASAVASGSGLT